LITAPLISLLERAQNKNPDAEFLTMATLVLPVHLKRTLRKMAAQVGGPGGAGANRMAVPRRE